MMRKTPLKRTGFKPRAKPLSGILRTASLPAKPLKPKMRKCAICRTPFTQRSMTHKACSPDCAKAVVERDKKKAAENAAKVDRTITRARKEAMKTRQTWLREATAAFNAFIRERDWDQPCISCGRFHDGAFDAGHYRSVGSMPALRFEEDNCHKQCVPCNQHKSGNIVEYRIRLAQKIGADRLARLEGPHEAAKYTIEDARTIKATYKAKLKALQAERKNYQEAA